MKGLKGKQCHHRTWIRKPRIRCNLQKLPGTLTKAVAENFSHLLQVPVTKVAALGTVNSAVTFHWEQEQKNSKAREN